MSLTTLWDIEPSRVGHLGAVTWCEEQNSRSYASQPVKSLNTTVIDCGPITPSADIPLLNQIGLCCPPHRSSPPLMLLETTQQNRESNKAVNSPAQYARSAPPDSHA